MVWLSGDFLYQQTAYKWKFGFSRFWMFNFDCLLLKLLICSLGTKKIYSFVCPLQTRSSGMISGTQIYSTLFLKKWFLRSLLFYTIFHEAEKLKRNLNTFLKVIQRFWYVQHIRFIFKKKNSIRSSQSFNLDKILWYWKNLGMLRFSRLGNQFLQPPLHTHSCLHVSFSKAAIFKSKAKQIVNLTILKTITTTFFFGCLEE